MREEMAAGSSFVWFAAGRLVPAKDFPNLLRAFRLVRAANPDAQLWIAGAAPAPVSQRVKHGDNFAGDFVGVAASVRGAHEQVHWLGLRRDMPALLDAADAFVQASAWEGMPLAVGEAMAMAKPVIATNAGGTREIVGETGTIVPTKDSDALAAAMLDLMRQSEERRCVLGQAARTRIAEGFSMDTRAHEWEALYGTVVDARD
jgi:glycosyltransferase involved in cell wall biosynthesis